MESRRRAGFAEIRAVLLEKARFSGENPRGAARERPKDRGSSRGDFSLVFLCKPPAAGSGTHFRPFPESPDRVKTQKNRASRHAAPRGEPPAPQ